jgi:hypothetical protein
VPLGSILALALLSLWAWKAPTSFRLVLSAVGLLVGAIVLGAIAYGSWQLRRWLRHPQWLEASKRCREVLMQSRSSGDREQSLAAYHALRDLVARHPGEPILVAYQYEAARAHVTRWRDAESAELVLRDLVVTVAHDRLDKRVALDILAILSVVNSRVTGELVELAQAALAALQRHLPEDVRPPPVG